ncbi:putative wall-associated receptor kinase-like 11 [Tripterygium wilfordii]|uniref:putative wall-associated receptor kinase-like 11 n=1 Tax=Tripterygium wilfordii TaxID=458696 RepID=UPI0018F846C7|nr:putative wall-associated receptor kinase-like 11 [Tripterygium wilfordii]
MIQCSCHQGSKGNPYLLEGCQDIDECNQYPPICSSSMVCKNLPGAYTCYSIKTGESRDYTVLHDLIQLHIGIGAGAGLVFALLGSWCFHKALKKRNKAKLKEKNFKRNGGVLLQQQLTSSQVNVEEIKIFGSKELEKATENFSKERMLGQGGQGAVYKGILADGRIVAVKKSKVVGETKVREFINEVAILSQIFHMNAVKVRGCCLETEVPLLVYEFIPNGTLYEYLHTQNDEFPFTWEMRLGVAIDVAGALSYLHSAASLPIYHRDIKSSNILLDDKYKAKIADFGISRSFAIDQTLVTTKVQGTFGYVDPEYFQSSQFTEKSDVYSFGVVLVEFLTGKKVVISTSEEAESLVALFNSSIEEDSLFSIIDSQVLNHPVKEDIMTVAHLAKKCLSLNGKNRPTMKEVGLGLEKIQIQQTTSRIPQHHNDQQEFKNAGGETSKAWKNLSTSSTKSSGMESFSIHQQT